MLLFRIILLYIIIFLMSKDMVEQSVQQSQCTEHTEVNQAKVKSAWCKNLSPSLLHNFFHFSLILNYLVTVVSASGGKKSTRKNPGRQLVLHVTKTIENQRLKLLGISATNFELCNFQCNLFFKDSSTAKFTQGGSKCSIVERTICFQILNVLMQDLISERDGLTLVYLVPSTDVERGC